MYKRNLNNHNIRFTNKATKTAEKGQEIKKPPLNEINESTSKRGNQNRTINNMILTTKKYGVSPFILIIEGYLPYA